jgi:hypothetical protein
MILLAQILFDVEIEQKFGIDSIWIKGTDEQVLRERKKIRENYQNMSLEALMHKLSEIKEGDSAFFDTFWKKILQNTAKEYLFKT